MEFLLSYNPFAPLVVAVLLGMALGLERRLARKTAGLRTYALVSLGSALLIVIGRELGAVYPITGDDLLRVVAGIVTGIGFLGAGVIMLRDQTTVGLTTAAGLWVASAIGIASGFGLYTLAFFTTLLTILVFTLFWSVEEKVARIAQTNGS